MSAPLTEIRALALVNIQSNQNLLRVGQITNKLSDRQRQFFHQRWRGNELRFTCRLGILVNINHFKIVIVRQVLVAQLDRKSVV